MRLWQVFSTVLLSTAISFTVSAGNVDRLDLSSFDVTTLIKQPAVYEPEVFKHAIRIISSLENAPSCHRLAVRTLLNSCQSLETSKGSDSNVALDEVKSLFAARLAICELSGAHAAIPTPCLSMIPKSSAEDHGLRCLLPGSRCERAKETRQETRLGFEKLSLRQVNQCLNTLESRPQWWTSYSNARQNAVVMCHAARCETEREQLLETHKSMAKVSSDISQAIAEASDRSSDTLKAQKVFADHVKGLQADVVEDVQAARLNVQVFLHDMFAQVEQFIGGTFARLATGATSATENLESLNSRLEESAVEADTLQSKIKGTMETFSSQQEALAREQLKHSQLARDLALALHNSLDTVQSQQIEPLDLALRHLRTLIDAQTQLMRLMYEKQGSMDGRLDRFNETIHSLQARALIAEESLKIHVETQGILFENLTSNMALTNELASSINASLVEVGKRLSASFLGLFNPFQGIIAGWPAFSVGIVILSYLSLGAEVARRVAVAELVLYALTFLCEQMKYSGRNGTWLPKRNTPLPSFVLSETLLYFCVVLVVLIGPFFGCMWWTRRHHAKSRIGEEDIFADALSRHKGTLTSSSAFSEYAL